MTIADINTKARYLVDADTTSWTAAQLLIEINNAYEEIVATLIEMDKTWDFGDSNYASLATGLSNLTAGTQAYQLTSGWLTLSSVSVMDSNGLYNKLKPIIIK